MLFVYVILLAGPLVAKSKVSGFASDVKVGDMILVQPGNLKNNFTNAEKTGPRDAKELQGEPTPSPFRNHYRLRNF